MYNYYHVTIILMYYCYLLIYILYIVINHRYTWCRSRFVRSVCHQWSTDLYHLYNGLLSVRQSVIGLCTNRLLQPLTRTITRHKSDLISFLYQSKNQQILPDCVTAEWNTNYNSALQIKNKHTGPIHSNCHIPFF